MSDPLSPTTPAIPTAENRPAYGRAGRAGGPAGGLTAEEERLAQVLAGIARRAHRRIARPTSHT